MFLWTWQIGVMRARPDSDSKLFQSHAKSSSQKEGESSSTNPFFALPLRVVAAMVVSGIFLSIIMSSWDHMALRVTRSIETGEGVWNVVLVPLLRDGLDDAVGWKQWGEDYATLDYHNHYFDAGAPGEKLSAHAHRPPFARPDNDCPCSTFGAAYTLGQQLYTHLERLYSIYNDGNLDETRGYCLEEEGQEQVSGPSSSPLSGGREGWHTSELFLDRPDQTDDQCKCSNLDGTTSCCVYHHVELGACVATDWLGELTSVRDIVQRYAHSHCDSNMSTSAEPEPDRR